MGVTPAWHPIKKNGLKPVQKMALGPPLRSQDKFKHRSFRSEPHRFFSVGVRHTFSLRRELQEKTNTGLKDSYTYPDKNTCAFAQHPCHPM
jgi:hypothetical protein